MLGLLHAIVKLVTAYMSRNTNTGAARNYHDSTSHSYASVRTNPHSLDFATQPLPFKIYPELAPSRLPTEVHQTGVAALSAIATTIAARGTLTPHLAALANLLYLSAGITRQRKYPGGEIYFRAAACTGALYEVELYLVCGDLVCNDLRNDDLHSDDLVGRDLDSGSRAGRTLPGGDLSHLPAGLYHFAPAEFGLRQLRAGDYRGVLVEATGGDPAIERAPLSIVCTCTYWRNAWKYQNRTYRHFGWDNGTLLANLLAVATALGLPAKVVSGFVDTTVNRLLDVDSEREVAFSIVPIGHNPKLANSIDPLPRAFPMPDISPLGFETVSPSRAEIDYPMMREIHAASSLDTADEVAAWRSRAQPLNDAPPKDEVRNEDHVLPPAPSPATAVPLDPLSDREMPCDPIEQVILRRGSSRQFARTPISMAQLSTMLSRATRGVPADFLASSPENKGPQLNDLYLIVNAVEGLESGAYVFTRDRGVLECLKQGNFRDEAGYLGLEQQLAADAAVDIFFLADLRPIFERFGNRGYRAVQLEAGILGGKLYLAAYAQRLGATGLTFYDDDVVRFFSPHSEGKSAIFLVAIGHSARRQP